MKETPWGLKASLTPKWGTGLGVLIRWTARRSNQSILKEINPEYSLEGLMLKVKLRYLATWCEELTHWKRPWYWERLKAKGEGGNRRWDGWVASLTQWTWVWANSKRWRRTGKPGVLQSVGSRRVQHNLATEQQRSICHVLSAIPELPFSVKFQVKSMSCTWRAMLDQSWWQCCQMLIAKCEVPAMNCDFNENLTNFTRCTQGWAGGC